MDRYTATATRGSSHRTGKEDSEEEAVVQNKQIARS